jgi:hypothetical protein
MYKYEGEDNLLIDTPWGKKRWGMLREAMELYNKQQNKEATIFSSSIGQIDILSKSPQQQES